MKANIHTVKDARDACEALLQTERTYRIEHSILPSEIDVIDRLLTRGLELESAYQELYKKLSDHPSALRVFFDQLLGVAVHWSPEANQEAREEKSQLVKVNQRIEAVAAELAKLLAQRTELKNHSGFSCDTLYHPIDLIHAAAASNYSYEHWVKESLEAVTYQFDLKYWPTLSQLAQAIADDAAKAKPQAHDVVTSAGTEGPGGLADTFRSFFAALEESKVGMHGFIPDTFRIKDQSVADLIGCALGLSPGAVNSDFVKRLRQRARERARI